MKKLILASNSPRRKFILEKFGFDFTVKTSDFNEKDEKNNPIETAVNNALGKAKDVFSKLSKSEKENGVVIGADTVVWFNGKILGKPKDKLDAINTLQSLSGKYHSVYTGYAVIDDKGERKGYGISKVLFNDLSEKFIKDYVDSGKPMDKAGSYGLQDGVDIAKSFEGSYYNIIGLPIEEMLPIINKVLKN